MPRVPVFVLACAAALAAAACQTPIERVSVSPIGSGKGDVDLADVPDAVLAAAKALRPEMSFTEAEVETRNGLTYYDVGGTLPSGDEIELDIMEDGDGWRVVEVQRDIAFADAPEPVRAAMAAEHPDFVPRRVIESDQGDGVVIYEHFGPGPSGDEVKIEVKLADGEAGVLTEEWAH